MKNIKNYINESVDYWKNTKLISKNDLIKFANQALKNTKLFASDIQEEISQYEDPDDLWDAYDNENLDKYCKWINELSNLLADDNKYGGTEGDICDAVFDVAYDLLEELYKMNSK